jgi:chemotaxis methyl-accepting protein methylase
LLSVPELIGAARIRPDGALWNAIADNLAQATRASFRDRSQFEKLRTQILPAALQQARA